MAHAAITTLLQSLEQLLQPNPLLITHRNEPVESLYNKVNLLQGFLEGSQKKRYDCESMKLLEVEIRDVSCKARDIIDSKLSNVGATKNARSRKKAHRSLCRSLQEITEKVDFIQKKLVKISQGKKDAIIKGLQAGESVLGSLSRGVYMKKHVVGLKNDLQMLKDRLVLSPLKLETIPIEGMAGVGKTTLARKLFEDPSIVYHFHVRLWVTVSQDFRIRVLLQDFCQLGNDNKINIAELAERLFKSLRGRRYLIVLDDVWSTEAWNAVKFYFPDDNNGSTIILTSRLKEVAICANRQMTHHINLLNPFDSWKLLHKKLFVDERCPVELLEIGMRIAAKCQGLPLAIVVVAGYLLKIDRTRESWASFADSVSSFVTGDPQQCLDIIALSYNQLPHHLKACFLYFAAFPEDHEIPVSTLIHLWVAEGFLKQVPGKSLEEVAKECLVDLIDRNLILVRKVSYGRIKTCIIHDVLRDLCLKEAVKENFIHIISRNSHVLHEGKTNPCRLSFHLDSSFSVLSTSHIYSILCFRDISLNHFFRHSALKLLRVLDIICCRSIDCFPVEILHLCNLRYLALSITVELPSIISNLQNLQILVLNIYSEFTTLPWEIWTMKQLRHLCFNFSSFLQNPTKAEVNGQVDPVLRSLQTLSKLSFSCCSAPVLASLPNLKKLGLYETADAHITEKLWLDRVFPSGNLSSSIHTIDSNCSNISNVAQLRQLEVLKLHFVSLFAEERRWVPRVDEFPPNLKKLTLSSSHLPWENMNVLSMLPNLEVLKLKNNAFVGSEWEQYEEGFHQLKYLLIDRTDLVHWRASSTQFPSLQHLGLFRCRCLREVPLDFAEILDLQRIDVYDSHDAVSSVMQIKNEQESMGNDGLVVCIGSAFK